MVSALRLVNLVGQLVCRSVQLKDRIVNLPKRLENPGSSGPCGISQHRDLRFREILVPQRDGNVYNLRERRIQCRLPIARECDGIYTDALGGTIFQFRGQGLPQIVSGRDPLVFPAVLVPSALAIYAIEIA